MDTFLLETENLTKNYGATIAAQNVSIKLASGRVHALVGENGAGKSTIIKMMTGLVRPTSGHIKWQNVVTDFHSPHKARSLGVVAVHQELTLADNLTIAQNIWLGHEETRSLGTIDLKKLSIKSTELIKSMGLEFDPTMTVGKLSLSEKQLVEILKALSLNPKLLILDEATSALAENDVERLYKTVRKMSVKGCSVLFVSHRMKEIFRFCDFCSIMKDGRIVFEDSINNLDEHLIIMKMTGRDLSQNFPPKNHEAGAQRPLLRVQNLCTRAGLRDISFELHRGEILGLGGLKGHGQVDLLKSLFGMDTITAGFVSVEGRKVSLRNSHSALSQGIVLVPEDRKSEGLFIDRSVEENMIACSFDRCAPLGVLSHRLVKDTVKSLVEKMGVKAPSVKEPVRRLSGGNQQKIAVGRWLQSDFKVLLLIEPTRGIDIGTKLELYRLLRNLARKGAGIIVSTNEIIELVGLCDRVLVMFEKTVASELAGEEISEHNIVSSSFGHKD